MKAKSCGIIPFIREGDQFKFLLIKHQLGHWSFPKGTPNPGETDLETAKREFTEETGIDNVVIISEDTFIEKYFMVKDGVEIDKDVIFFLGEVSDLEAKVQPEEVAEYGWFDYDGVINRLTYQETARVFKEAFKKLIEYGEVA